MRKAAFLTAIIFSICLFGADSLNISRIGYYNTEGISRDIIPTPPFAHIADAYSGLVTIDISAPANPTYGDVYDTPGEVNSIFIYDTLLYLADISGGLRLFNLANPLDPIQISRDTLYATYTSVVARDRYAFCGLGWSGFTVIDFTDLSDPDEYGPISSLGGYVYSIAMDGDRVYLACGDGDLKIIDISDPFGCDVIGSMTLPGSARDVFARRDTVFVASYTEGLHIIDACNPESPILISSLDSDGYASGVWAGDTTVFLADYANGIRAISIYDPEYPVETGFYKTVHNCLDVSVAGGYIFACFGNDGVYILDGGLQLNAPSTIDSVWIWEDCSPEPSSVHVCYELIDPESDQSDVFARMSSDGGETWSVPFISLFDTDGSLGEDVMPGTNCFGWAMANDLPNLDNDLFTIEISTTSPHIRQLTVPGTACPYLAGMPYGTQITDWWGGDTIPTVAPIRIDIDAGVDSIVLIASGAVAYGDTYPSYGPNGGSPTPTIPEYGEITGISYFTDCPISALMAVFLNPGLPDSSTMPPQLSSFTSNPMAQQSVYIGEGPVTLIPPEGANRLFLGVNDHYRWQDNTGAFEVTVKIFDANSYSYFRASDSLDSRPPELEIDCPEDTLIVGTNLEITWTKSDRSAINEPTELAFSKSPYRETYSTSDNTFLWSVSSDFIPDCTLTVTVQDSFCNATTDTCLLAVEEAALPCTAWVDSVWFTEETDCDDRNVIELCYNLSSSCPDSQFFISMRASDDLGETWDIAVDSIFGATGDLGDVLPGEHCFFWEVGYDYSNIEVAELAVEFGVSVNYDTFLVIDSIDVSDRPNYGRGMAFGDGYYFIYDLATGWIYQTDCIECPAADSFWAGTDNNCDIDYEDGYIYYADSSGGDCKRVRRIEISTGTNQRITALPEHASDIEGVQVIGDSLIVAWLGIEGTFTEPDEPNMLLYLDLADPFPITSWETLFVSDIGACRDAEGMTFARGNVWASNDSGRIIGIDLDTMDYVGCFPVPNEEEGAEGLCYDGEFMWYHNFHDVGTMQIYKIKLWDSFVNSTVGYGPSDSRPPRINIACPDSIEADEPYNITWTVDDLFHADNPCSVHVFGCGDERHHYVTGSSVSWMSPWECPACTIVVVTRDSFCNWGTDTCVTRVFEPAPPCSVFIDSVWFAQEADCDERNIVEICYDFHSACPDSGYFATILGSTNGGTSWSVEIDSIFDSEGDIGPGTLPGVHCFSWEAGYDFSGWEGDDFSIRIDVAGHGYNDYAIATGTLDTDVPEIVIDCPVDTLEAGVPYNFGWTIGDDYYMGDPCSVTVQGCGIWERHEVEGILFMWTAPWACSTYSIIVATRDSFCNWGADTCEFVVTGEEMPCSTYVDTLWFAQETDCNDSSIVQICYNLISSCPESTYAITIIGSEDGEIWDHELSTLYDYTGDIGDSVFAGEHCFYWDAGRDLTNWEGFFALRLDLLTDDLDSLLEQWFAYDSLDSRPPTITLDCPESPMLAGDTAIWSWSIDDLFSVEDYFEIYLNWCAGETTFVLDSAAYEWVVPPEAEGCNVQFTVAGRDSFCNWAADTCWTQIDTTSLRCKVLIYCNSTDEGAYNIREFDSLVAALEAHGNEVTAYDASDGIAITSALLSNYSQFWFIDSKNSLDTTLTSSEVTAIRNYIEGGRGVAVLADHHPYYTRDAGYLLSYFDIEVAGSENHHAGSLCNSEIDFATHYVTRGLYQLACFTSEGRIEYTGDGDYTPISTYRGDTLQAALIDVGRLFVDASFYRYLDTYIPQCDGVTLAENVACWIEPNGCGCEIESCMVEVTASAEDSTICLDENAILSASVVGAFGEVAYDWWSSPHGYTSTMQNPTFGPLDDDTWFFVRATDEADCIDIDSIFVDVLIDEVRDTFMCLGDTMTFCEDAICDSGGITRGGITVTRDGIPVYGAVVMDEDSSCMNFIPLDIGEYIVCHENYYDDENDCCYDVCWHVTVCCKPYAELASDPTDDCSWNFTLSSIPDSGCADWDSVAWTVESFYEQPVDTSILENSLDLTLHGTDSVELCAIASTGCFEPYYCSFSICTTLTCFNELCCTLQINAVDDTICYGETANLCALLLGEDCPGIDTLVSEWTADGNVVGTEFCVAHVPESTTTYCYNSSYENEFGETCVLSGCKTIHVVPPPPDIWPEIEYVPMGTALELPIPCGEFGGGYVPDSVIVLEPIIGAPAETVGVYSPGDWCVLRQTFDEPTTMVFCYDFFVEECAWYSVECCTVKSCDLPEAELTTPNGACPSEGEVTVCVHNLNTEIDIDDILWSNGATTTCTEYPIEPEEAACGGYNSFASETIYAEICHECDGDYACIVESLVIEPQYKFWIDILPPGVVTGDSIDTEPHLVPPPATPADSLIDWFICDDDSLIYRGTARYPDGIHGATSLYEKTIYCAEFDYDYGDSRCAIVACDSVFVQDSLLTVIKSPCATEPGAGPDPDGWMEVDGYRRYATCKFTFPVSGDCMTICASDTDFVMPTAYVFDHWETSAGIYSYESCTTYCPTSPFDTVYAVYDSLDMCVYFGSGTGIIDLQIEELLEVDDSVFSMDNIIEPRAFTLENCGECSLDIALKWISAENISDYDCPPVEISNSALLDYNEIGIRGRMTSDSLPDDFAIIRNSYTSVIDPDDTPFAPGDALNLFIGVASPPDYHPCYPDDAEFQYRIALKLRWGVYLP